MARSPVTLGDFLRKDPSSTMVGAPRPRSPKQTDKKFNYAAGKNEDWNTVSNAVTALFQRKKLTKFELSSLMEKVKTVKQEINGPAICERFKESLVKGMIILREDVKAKNGEVLLDKLADSWSYFFCTIGHFFRYSVTGSSVYKGYCFVKFSRRGCFENQAGRSVCYGLDSPP